MKKLLILLFIAITMLHGANKKLTVYGYQNYMPFMDGKGSHAKGLYPILVNKIFTKAGYDVEFRILPWKRALKSAMDGKGIIAGLLKTKERSDVMDYSKPFYAETISIYTQDTKKFKFNSVNDLKNKKIGIENGFFYGDDFTKAMKDGSIKPKKVKSAEQNFRKLDKNRLDCILAEETIASINLTNTIFKNKIIKLDNAIYKGDIFIATAKSLKQKDILNKFNATLKLMKSDGSYQKIVNSFISNTNK